MRTTLGTVAGLVGGLITSLLCVALCWALQEFVGLSLFTWMLWLVVPAGAALVGFAASSGYYAGARLYDARANAVMALGMIGIAGLTQLLIYYATYATLELPDGRTVRQAVDYWTFLKIYLGNQRYSIGHATGASFDVGNLGYGIAGLQFLGFLAGGAMTFLILKGQPFCQKCGRYFRRKLAVSKQGSAEYVDALRAKPSLSTDYFGALQQPEGEGFRLNVVVSQCPDCSKELVSEQVELKHGSQWKALPQLSRLISPEEPVLALFQAMPDAKKAAFGRLRS